MNKQNISLFIGVATSVFVILVLNKFLVVDDCLDRGGSFDYQLGQCVLSNGEIHITSYANYVISLYFIFAIAVAFSVSRLVKFIWR